MKMQILVGTISVFFLHCAFADIQRETKTRPIGKIKNQIPKSVTIINDIRIYMQKGFTGNFEMFPISGDPPNKYFPIKQKEIGKLRYEWNDVDFFDFKDKNFDLSMIKTDYVYLVTAERPRSDWEEGKFSQVLQLITYCLVPCIQQIEMDISVKLYHKNKFLKESKSTTKAKQYFSPIYLFIPTSFDMIDVGDSSIEPSLKTTLFLEGFQVAMDEIHISSTPR